MRDATGARVDDRRLGREQRRDALGGARRAEDVGESLRQLLHGLREQRRELHEGDQRAERDLLVCEHPARAVPEDERARRRRQHRHQRHVDARQDRAAHRPEVRLGREPLELGEVRLLARERLGGARAEQHLAVGRGHRARQPPRLAARAHHEALEHRARERHRGHRRQRPQREPRVRPEHRGHDADDDRRAPREVEHHPRQDARHLRAVAGEPRDEPARRPRVEVRGLERLQLGEAVAAQAVGGARRDLARALDEQPHAAGEEQEDERVRAQDRPELRRLAAARLVDDAPDEERQRRLDRRDEHARAHEPRDRAAVRERARQHRPPHAQAEPRPGVVLQLDLRHRRPPVPRRRDAGSPTACGRGRAPRRARRACRAGSRGRRRSRGSGRRRPPRSAGA